LDQLPTALAVSNREFVPIPGFSQTFYPATPIFTLEALDIFEFPVF
jgi:hypothetical protein